MGLILKRPKSEIYLAKQSKVLIVIPKLSEFRKANFVKEKLI